jgi:glycosyltransferase involved in cell wall biosynthesis
MARASIVIPAHNEANVIGRLLEILAPLVKSGEIDVHVICNGCNDATYEIASGFAGVKAYEVKEPSRSAALNLGDTVAGDVFPRLYIDADIVLDASAIEKVVACLSEGPVLAAAPTLRVAVDGRPFPVRDFYDVFMRLPWVTEGLVGSGFYGVSREGHARFGEFPDILNDDLFFRSLFTREERYTVPDAEFWIEAPRKTWVLVRAKARVNLGTRQFMALRNEQTGDAMYMDEAEHLRDVDGRSRGFIRRAHGLYRNVADSAFWQLGRDRALWRPIATYAAIRVASAFVSHTYSMRDRELGWAQDRTTRDGVAVQRAS